MKPLQVFSLLVIVLILFTGCKSNSNNNSIETELKKNQFIGKIVYKEKKKNTRSSSQQKKDFYFIIDDKDYFIKISDGYVSEDKLLKYENQLIKIKGEIKNGEWEHQEPVGLNNLNPPKARRGNYIAIYRIINE